MLAARSFVLIALRQGRRVLGAASLSVSLAACATRPASIRAVLAQTHADGRVFVREVAPGSGAAQAGLQVNDEVLSVDGHDVRRLSPLELHLALSGKAGTTVRLTVWRRGEVERLTIERAPLEPK